jgi:hypothetical protein
MDHVTVGEVVFPSNTSAFVVKEILFRSVWKDVIVAERVPRKDMQGGGVIVNMASSQSSGDSDRKSSSASEGDGDDVIGEDRAWTLLEPNKKFFILKILYNVRQVRTPEDTLTPYRIVQ